MPTPQYRARQVYTVPSHPDNPGSSSSFRKINIRHPGYPNATNILFQFSACDAEDGIHYKTVYTACSIISNNRQDGYLSTDQDGVQRVELASNEGSLTQNNYYFHVPNDLVYAIVPTFSDWPYPHHLDLTSEWLRKSGRIPTSSDPPLPSNRCCMTRSTLALENAHLVPRNPTDLAWWRTNGMSQYVGQNQGHNSMSNKIRLRVDVHQLFDRRPRFAIIPKYGCLVAHVFDAEEAAEAVHLYHNVPLQELESAKAEFLYARLAWTVFPHLHVFLTAQRRRRLWILQANGDRVIQDVEGERCNDIYTQAQTRQRSTSPQKRPFGEAVRDEEEWRDDATEHRLGDDDGEDDDDDCVWRGRKRRRTTSGAWDTSFASQTSQSEALDGWDSDTSICEEAAVLKDLRDVAQ